MLILSLLADGPTVRQADFKNVMSNSILQVIILTESFYVVNVPFSTLQYEITLQIVLFDGASIDKGSQRV